MPPVSSQEPNPRSLTLSNRPATSVALVVIVALVGLVILRAVFGSLVVRELAS